MRHSLSALLSLALTHTYTPSLLLLIVVGRYASYTTIYLNDDTQDNVKGMAEMTLIKLGEMVDKPQAKRIQLMARQIEEAKRAEEARRREAEASAADREKKFKQEAMNKRGIRDSARLYGAACSSARRLRMAVVLTVGRW